MDVAYLFGNRSSGSAIAQVRLPIFSATTWFCKANRMVSIWELVQHR